MRSLTETHTMPTGTLVKEGLTDDQLVAKFNEMQEDPKLTDLDMLHAFGKNLERFVFSDRPNVHVRTVKQFGPVEYSDKEKRQYRLETKEKTGEVIMHCKIPLNVTRDRSTGSYNNQIEFPVPHSILTLKDEKGNEVKMRVLDVDTAGRRATAQIRGVLY